MGFLDMVQTVGGRLGIIEKVEARDAVAQPAKVRTRAVTLAELRTEIRAEEVRALAETPAELTVPFERIFETAGLPGAASGWNIDRLRQLLDTDPFKGQPREAIQSKILDVLARDRVDAEDLVKDAVARDQALDAFQDFAERKMQDRIAALEKKLADVESRIEQLRGEGSRLKEQAEADRNRWGEWLKRKRVLERDLARTVGHLVDRPVITEDE